MKNYSKMIAQVVGTIVAAVLPLLVGDQNISAQEWVNVAILAVGSLAVFAGPNVPGSVYTKFVLSALTAALTVLVSVISGGVTTGEWVQIAVAVLTALGVYQVKAPAVDA